MQNQTFDNEAKPVLKSGPAWFIGAFGVFLIGLAILFLFWDANLLLAFGLVAFGILSLWQFRKNEISLNGSILERRDWLWRRQEISLADLQGMKFNWDGAVELRFNGRNITISNDTRNLKNIAAALKAQAKVHIPYHEYTLVKRADLKRDQKLGCLDCHSIFNKNEVKSWKHLPKSILSGRKAEPFYAVCPSCQSLWVYSNTPRNPSVNAKEIVRMDAAMPKDDKGRRSLAFRPST